MNADEFYQSRQDSWKQLNALLDKAEMSIERMSPDEVTLLGQLYRAVTSDLAIAQRDFPRQRVVLYLNQLVGRAHAALYRGEPLAVRRLIAFATTGFPRIFRETFRFTLAATLLFLIPALLAGFVMSITPDAAQFLMPGGGQELIEYMEDAELWTNIPVAERPYASSAIMTNNIRVAMLAFGGGMLVGVTTVWVMVSNGLMFGGILGLGFYYHLGFELLNFVIGHGVIELSVIMVAGGSGLMLGWAIIRPGLLPRRDALAVAARKAVKLLAGCVPLLIIAGLIEGFVSPNEAIPWPVKWAVGIGTGVALYSYWAFAGRKID
ncbi:MAG: stage II sporulation protein M [Anaerolineae bacterium]|nr:stage II sporulation protein M [Anaerolineae bacterium]